MLAVPIPVPPLVAVPNTSINGAGGNEAWDADNGSDPNKFREENARQPNVAQDLTDEDIFAGSGGFDITVGGHTQLDGAVIGSTAAADKNTLDTGTLGFSDIDNQADFKVEHQSVGISTGGNIGSQFVGNMANGLLVGANNEGHADSTTHAAVSEGTITVRDTDNQQQNVDDLSRDVEQANNALSPIFDKEKDNSKFS